MIISISIWGICMVVVSVFSIFVVFCNINVMCVMKYLVFWFVDKCFCGICLKICNLLKFENIKIYLNMFDCCYKIWDYNCIDNYLLCLYMWFVYCMV